MGILNNIVIEVEIYQAPQLMQSFRKKLTQI